MNLFCFSIKWNIYYVIYVQYINIEGNEATEAPT